MADPAAERVLETPEPLDVRRTVGAVGVGPLDPCTRAAEGEAWRATRTPEGPVTFRVTGGAGRVRVQAWGPGAAWAMAHAEGLAGLADDRAGWEPRHPRVRALDERFPGIRFARGVRPVEVLMAAVCRQRVTWREAAASWRGLVLALGEPAPGPGGLLLPPAPERLRETPPWALAPHGLEEGRARTLRAVALHARKVDAVAAMTPAEARARLVALPGIGPWSAAQVAKHALGDADAVSLGDYHLPSRVAWLLAGEPRADDARMEALLEPWRGHRARIERLLDAGGVSAPSYGPRRGSWASDVKR